MSAAGGGLVEAISETTSGREAQGRFLFSATVELFEQYGFARGRQVGKHAAGVLVLVYFLATDRSRIARTGLVFEQSDVQVSEPEGAGAGLGEATGKSAR